MLITGHTWCHSRQRDEELGNDQALKKPRNESLRIPGFVYVKNAGETNCIELVNVDEMTSKVR